MVAASVNQGTDFFPDPRIIDFPDITANFTLTTVSTGSTPAGHQLRLRADIVAGLASFMEIALLAPVNLSASYLHIVTKLNIASIPWRVGLRSAAGYRMWDVDFGKDFTTVEADLDPSELPSSSDGTGTLDLSAVTRIRWEFLGVSNNNNRLFFTLPEALYYPKDSGLKIENGDTANPAKIPLLSAIKDPYDTGVLTVAHALIANTVRIARTVVLENNPVSDYDGSTIVFVNTGANGAEGLLFNLPSLALITNLNGQTTNSIQVFSQGPLYDWQDTATTGSAYTSILIDGARNVFLGLSTYAGKIVRAAETVTGGTALSLLFEDCAPVVYEWNGTAALTNCQFDASTSNYAVDFNGANFADGATFDASTISFVSQPLSRKFRLNAAGKTLNINAGATGLTVADVEVVAGVVNVFAAQASLTLSGLIPGSRVYVLNATNSTTLFNQIEPSGTFVGVVGTAGTSLLIRVANASGAPKYKRFETTATVPVSNFEIVVNQELDE